MTQVIKENNNNNNDNLMNILDKGFYIIQCYMKEKIDNEKINNNINEEEKNPWTKRKKKEWDIENNIRRTRRLKTK